MIIETYLKAKKVGARYAGKSASERTIKAYRTALNAAETLVGMPLEFWTLEEGDALLYAFEEEGFENAYRANILSAVRGFFDWYLATTNEKNPYAQKVHPLMSIKSPRISRKLPTILTKDQLDALFTAINNEKYQLFFKLMYYGGLRIGEVATIKHIDIQSEGIVVRGKGNKQRMVYLPASLHQELVDFSLMHQDSTFVFYGEHTNAKTNQPIALVHARKIFNDAKRACGLPEHLHPHNLRATSATHFHEDHGDLALTQKFLGHSRADTTMIYAQVADERLKQASRRTFS